MSSSRVLALSASALFAALAGCGDPAPEQPATSTLPKAVPKPKLVALPSEMVAAVAAGKSANAISIHFALGGPPTVSTPLPVQIAIVPHRAFTTVRVHFESHDGLTIPMGSDFGPANDAEPDKPGEPKYCIARQRRNRPETRLPLCHVNAAQNGGD